MFKRISVRGKVVVITGASSGIGRAAAHEFARRGARLVLAARRAAALEETALRGQQHGVLINVGSILSKIGQPFVPSYVISKFGLRGLSRALRAEFAALPAVHVATARSSYSSGSAATSCES